MGTYSSYQLGCLLRTGWYLVVNLLEVSEIEAGVMSSQLLTELLKSHSSREQILGCEPITYQPYLRGTVADLENK